MERRARNEPHMERIDVSPLFSVARRLLNLVFSVHPTDGGKMLNFIESVLVMMVFMAMTYWILYKFRNYIYV